MANTLKFGAGQWATKEGSTLAYNDENDNYKPLPFDFTRASNATVVNKAGLIETVGNGIPRIDFLGNTQGALKLEPQRTNLITQSEAFANSYWTKSGATIQADPSTAGSELITNGDFATDSDWIKGTGWSISGGTANCDGTNFATISQSKTLVVGKTYKYSFTISNQTQGGVRFFVGNSVGVTHSVNGTFTGYITYSSGSSILLQARDSFIGSIDNVSVKEVQGFTSPDGTTNAYKLVENSANSRHFINSTQFNTPDTVYSSSVYVKADGRNKIAFRENTQTGNYASFNLSNGTLIATNGISASIELISNGWYRINYQITSGANFILGIELLSDSYTSGDPYSNPYQGNGTSGVYIAFAQAELGSYATSYIPTQGSAVTRLADVCSQTPPDGVIGQTEGTVYVDVNISSIESVGVYSGWKIDGTSGNQIAFITYPNGRIQATVFVGGSLVVNINDNNYGLTSGVHKIALAYKQNDYILYIDGSVAGSNTSATVPIVNEFDISYSNGGSLKYNETKLYNTRLSNAELQALTS